MARSLNLSWTTVLKEDVDGMQTLVNSAEVGTHNYELKYGFALWFTAFL